MTAYQDQVAVPGIAMVRYDTSDGPPGLANPTRTASLNRGHVKSPRYLRSDKSLIRFNPVKANDSARGKETNIKDTRGRNNAF